MEPPSYMWSVVDGNVVMRRIPIQKNTTVCIRIKLYINNYTPKTQQYSWQRLKMLSLELNEGTSHYMDLCSKQQAPTASHSLPCRKIVGVHRTGI
jgi:hypothetical protein